MLNIKYLKLFCLAVFFVLTSTRVYGQFDPSDTATMPDITVTTFRQESIKTSSVNISILNTDSLRNLGNFNITDMMAKTPGVSMLTTGVAIAKPVIRGAAGNRVLVLLNGLKFDNQQWQEEHGLGISDLGIGAVEIIKGPMSVLYGTEAIGGVINLLEEQKPEVGKHQLDASLKYNSNTNGGSFQLGYKKNTGKRWFRIRAGVDNNADYSDGNNKRVLNSRFDGYAFKATYGFKRRNWISNNNFSSSFNRFGFIFNDIYNFVLPDARWNRQLNVNPTHLVLLNVLSSENKIILKNKSHLNLNLGVQSNERMENEGGGKISLNMHLLTVQYLLKWDKKISTRSNLTLTNLGSFEDNMNFGSRKIVPNARMQESNVAAYIESRLNHKLVLENGAGIGYKRINTFFTAGVNSPEKDIHPFSKQSPYYNIFSGLSFTSNEKWNVKFNVASGVRVPNLAELSSNGLHEGVFTYEIGNPQFKNEQVFSGNLFIARTGKKFDVFLSPFYNQYINYVYLAPTTEKWFGYPVYRYKQQNATQYGTELTALLTIVKKLRAGVSLSGMVSKTADGKYTPYTPAKKISPTLNYSIQKNQNKYQFYASADYCFTQKQVATNEISTPSYFLLNAGFSAKINRKNRIFEFSVAGNNLLNRAYYDNLSRFKYYGLLNIGRNIAVTCRIYLLGDNTKKGTF